MTALGLALSLPLQSLGLQVQVWLRKEKGMVCGCVGVGVSFVGVWVCLLCGCVGVSFVWVWVWVSFVCVCVSVYARGFLAQPMLSTSARR